MVIIMISSFLASSEKSVFQELWEYILETYLTPKYGYYANIEINTDPTVTPAALFFAIFFAIMAACAMTIFNRRTLGRPVRLLLKHDAIGKKNAKTFDEIGAKKSRLMKIFINRFTLSKAIRCVEEDEFYGITEDDAEKTDETAKEYKNLSNSETESAAGDAPTLSRSEYKKKLKREKREEARNLSRAKVEEIGSRHRNAYYVGAASKVKYKRNIETDRFYIADGMQYRAEIRFSTKGSNPVILVFVAIGYIIVGVLAIKFLPALLSLIDGAIGNFK